MYILPFTQHLLILSDSSFLTAKATAAAMISRPTDTAHSTSPMTIAATFPLMSLAASSSIDKYNITLG